MLGRLRYARRLLPVALLSTYSSIAWCQSRPPLEGPSIRPDVSVKQSDIDQKDPKKRPTFRNLVESGRHFFSVPFTIEDGYGEGPNGPRMTALKALQADQSSRFNFPVPATVSNGEHATLLRLNGLDARDCGGCHNFMGVRSLKDTVSSAFGPRSATNGSAADVVANAYINPALQNPSACSIDPNWVDRPPGVQCTQANYPSGYSGSPGEVEPGLPKKYFMFARNPPHVFGTGYAQRLAEEISIEISAQFTDAVLKVVESGAPVTANLSSKGIQFGSISISPNAPGLKAFSKEKLLSILASGRSDELTIDYSNMKGVSQDLIVRPFQWKGIAQNERNFVRDALNFHFGMESTEGRECDPKDPKAPANCTAIVNGPDADLGVVAAQDIDQDGRVGEMSYGNVTALTVFTMSIRPPEIPKATTAKEKRGEALFKGVGLSGGENDPAACSSCHRPSLHIVDRHVTVYSPAMMTKALRSGDLPEDAGFTQEKLVNPLGLSATGSGTLPTKMLVLKALMDAGYGEDNRAPALRLKTALSSQLPGYTFDLSLPHNASLPLSYPRLPTAKDGGIDVPLFSDLKRHQMGGGLCDQHTQTTDSASIPPVPVDEFLTRPLWGVADTGPWLHDGRAFSLRSAILLHDGDAVANCHASEAKAAVSRFRALDTDGSGDGDALIAYLETFKLPADTRYEFDER